jgi:hypothetical protein
MNKSTIATSLLIAGGLMGLFPSIATGEAQTGLNIADNDSVYVDGKTFQVIPGKAKGDTAAQIKSLFARDLGPGAIIMRSGNKLYIASVENQLASQSEAAAPPNFAYDPRSINPSLQGGGSWGYNQRLATDYAYDPRSINPRLAGGGSAGYNQNVATDNAYDPNRVAAAQPSVIYDPDYVEYRLKKAFENDWTPISPK